MAIAALLWTPSPASCWRMPPSPPNQSPLPASASPTHRIGLRAAGTADRTRTAPAGWWWSGPNGISFMRTEPSRQAGTKDSIRYHFLRQRRHGSRLDVYRRCLLFRFFGQDATHLDQITGRLVLPRPRRRATHWLVHGRRTNEIPRRLDRKDAYWLALDRQWYYFSNDGSMATGWRWLDGAWYLLSRDGVMARGVVFDGSGWSRFDDSGRWLGYCGSSR